MKTVILICVLLALSTAFKNTQDSEHHQGLWDNFKQQFDKIYETEQELEHRFNVFKDNLSQIFEHQDDDEHADYSATQFADLTAEEFESQYLTLASHRIDENDIPQQDQDQELGIWEMLTGADEKKIDLPKSFDWRDKGVVTEAKAQSTCGACWAFSTAAIIEAQYALKHNKLVNFSEQQLIDCDTVNDGCGGGLMTDAYKFLQKQGGMQYREEYGKYLNRKDTCHFDEEKVRAKIVNFYQIAKDEDAIQRELYQNGPIAVGVNGRFLQFYDGGILNNKKCNDRINHAVVIVGWGEENGTKYWIIKNQWGKKWGNDGYFKLVRGEKRCGVHTYASIAFVE